VRWQAEIWHAPDERGPLYSSLDTIGWPLGHGNIVERESWYEMPSLDGHHFELEKLPGYTTIARFEKYDD